MVLRRYSDPRRSNRPSDNTSPRSARRVPTETISHSEVVSQTKEALYFASSDAADLHGSQSMLSVHDSVAVTSTSPTRQFDALLFNLHDARVITKLTLLDQEDAKVSRGPRPFFETQRLPLVQDANGQHRPKLRPKSKNVSECGDFEHWKELRTRCLDHGHRNAPRSGKSPGDLVKFFLKSESLALSSLKALLLQGDLDRHGVNCISNGDGIDTAWPIYYRPAEMLSDKLPAIMDRCLQVWAQPKSHEWSTQPSHIYQAALDVRSPLHACSALGFQVLARIYLEMGHNPDILAYPNGQSALHLGAAGGYPKIIELLLDRGADIESRTLCTGRTALQIAAFRGHEDAVELLLKKGANVDAEDGHGDTAFDLAKRNGNDAVVHLILLAKTE